MSVASQLSHTTRSPHIREGCIRVNVRSRNEIRINESLEMPQSITLRSLRLFLRKTFPYLPYRFEFETETSVRVDSELENKILVSTMGNVIYMTPYIPKYPKGHEKEEKKPEVQIEGRRKDKNKLNEQQQQQQRGRSPQKNGRIGSPNGKKLSPIRNNTNTADGINDNMEWVTYDGDVDVNEPLVPDYMRRSILDAWKTDEIATLASTHALTQDGALVNPDSANNSISHTNATAVDSSNGAEDENLVGHARDVSTLSRFNTVTLSEDTINNNNNENNENENGTIITNFTTNTAIKSVSDLGLPEKFVAILKNLGLRAGDININKFRDIDPLQRKEFPTVSFDDTKEFRRYALRNALFLKLMPATIMIQCMIRKKLARNKVNRARLQKQQDEWIATQLELEAKEREAQEILASQPIVYQVNDEVLARLDGDWLPARITMISNDDSYELHYHHGEIAKGVSARYLRYNNSQRVPLDAMQMNQAIEQAVSIKEQQQQQQNKNNYDKDGRFLGQGGRDSEVEDNINTNANTNTMNSDDISGITHNQNMNNINSDECSIHSNTNRSIDTQSLPPFLEDAPMEGMTMKQLRELEKRQEIKRKEIEEKDKIQRQKIMDEKNKKDKKLNRIQLDDLKDKEIDDDHSLHLEKLEPMKTNVGGMTSGLFVSLSRIGTAVGNADINIGEDGFLETFAYSKTLAKLKKEAEGDDTREQLSFIAETTVNDRIKKRLTLVKGRHVKGISDAAAAAAKGKRFNKARVKSDKEIFDAQFADRRAREKTIIVNKKKERESMIANKNGTTTNSNQNGSEFVDEQFKKLEDLRKKKALDVAKQRETEEEEEEEEEDNSITEIANTFAIAATTGDEGFQSLEDVKNIRMNNGATTPTSTTTANNSNNNINNDDLIKTLASSITSEALQSALFASLPQQQQQQQQQLSSSLSVSTIANILATEIIEVASVSSRPSTASNADYPNPMKDNDSERAHTPVLVSNVVSNAVMSAVMKQTR